MKLAPIPASAIRLSRILFATDFSDESFHALEHVLALNRNYAATVFITHVIDPLSFQFREQSVAAEERAALHNDAQTKLNELRARHGLQGRDYESVVLDGEIPAAIEKFVEKENIDLIVLGSRGGSGLDRFFLGSVSEEIFRTVHCPVMTIGPEVSQTANAIDFENLLFATDFSTHSKTALPYVMFFLGENPSAKVTLAHFVHPDIQAPFERQRLRRRFEAELREMLPDGFQDQIADTVVEFCKTADGILEFANCSPTDLIVLGVRYGGAFLRAITHGPSSIAEKVIAKAPCPVLTVRGSS